MISVIVPYYCTKKEYFDKCMKSILCSNSSDIEVLVIDDGSPSTYHFIIDAYLSDMRVKVFHINHVGVSMARNIGIEKATGEWITFVDSDDYLEPNSMDILLTVVNKNKSDLIYYNGYGDKEGRIIKNHFFLKEGIDYGLNQESKKRIMESAFSIGFLPRGYAHSFSLGGVCCKLIRREFLINENISYNSEVHFAEDTLFTMELLQKARHIIYVDEYLYHYNINNESVTNKYRVGLKEDMDIFFRYAEKFIKLNGLEKELNRAYYLRAYIELQRCIRKEIWHRHSTLSILEKYKITKKMLKSEPYNIALNLKKEDINELKYKIIAVLLRNNFIQTYICMYTTSKKVIKLVKKMK